MMMMDITWKMLEQFWKGAPIAQLAPLILHTRRLFSLSSLSLLIDENNIGCLPAITFKNDFFPCFLLLAGWLALAAWLIPSELHYEQEIGKRRVWQDKQKQQQQQQLHSARIEPAGSTCATRHGGPPKVFSFMRRQSPNEEMKEHKA